MSQCGALFQKSIERPQARKNTSVQHAQAQRSHQHKKQIINHSSKQSSKRKETDLSPVVEAAMVSVAGKQEAKLPAATISPNPQQTTVPNA